MAQRSSFVLRPLGSQKRVLLVATSYQDAAERSECLRRRGYEVDSASCAEAAMTMTRSRSYDIIVIPVELNAVCAEDLSRKLQRLNPNATIACLADCKKPLPSLPPGRLLWKGEPLEYFIARFEALAHTA
ncbi:MAG TPA: hypothetical protein VN577_05345 [Terriglobales bacterium]|nr:hypothetical protein [Terriglobales bacterium]